MALVEAEKKAKDERGKQARREAVLMSWLSPSGGGKQYRDPTGVAAKRA